MDSFTDRICSPKESDDLHLALGEFFFGCNIPFDVVESDKFVNLIKKLRPAYKLPTRKTLSTTFLDKVYEKVNAEQAQIDSHSVLLIDGWKNCSSNTKNVVSILHNTNGKRMFLNSFDFSGVKETGDALTKLCSSLSYWQNKNYEYRNICSNI